MQEIGIGIHPTFSSSGSMFAENELKDFGDSD